MKKKNEEDKYSGKETENGSFPQKNDIHFDLPDKSKEYTNLSLKDDDLDPSGNFLQKLHLRNHSHASKETIHEMYRTEEEIGENEPGSVSAEDELIFNEVRYAISEFDIINLRSNLQFISKNVSAHKYCFEEIEEYIEGVLDEELKSKLDEESSNNPSLADEITLFKEINQAIVEKDVMQIRANLMEICKNESSHNRSIEEIDNYLCNQMEEQDKEAFEYEMLNNSGLAKDVRMHSEINESIREKDILLFRENLKSISAAENGDDTYQKRGFASLVREKIIWYAAASIILMISLNFVIRNHNSSNTELYQEYFLPFDSSLGTDRSASNIEGSTLNSALNKLNQKDYETALKLFSTILKEDPDNAVCNFYTGTIRQIKGNYADAIQSFDSVIKQGDNLFVEQSQWYIGLCYLNLKENDKAIRQFKKIVAQKGYYQKKSEEILAKLE